MGCSIQEAVRRSREFQLNDSAVYYFNLIPTDWPRYSTESSQNKWYYRDNVQSWRVDLQTFRCGRSEKWTEKVDSFQVVSTRRMWLHHCPTLLESYAGSIDPVRLNMQFSVICLDFCSTIFLRLLLIVNLFKNRICERSTIDFFVEKLPRSPLKDYFQITRWQQLRCRLVTTFCTDLLALTRVRFSFFWDLLQLLNPSESYPSQAHG